MYLRFLFCLSLGLVGVCMVLKTLIDTLFTEWDFFEELGLFVRSPSTRSRSRQAEDADGALAEYLGMRAR